MYPCERNAHNTVKRSCVYFVCANCMAGIVSFVDVVVCTISIEGNKKKKNKKVLYVHLKPYVAGSKVCIFFFDFESFERDLFTQMKLSLI